MHVTKNETLNIVRKISGFILIFILFEIFKIVNCSEWIEFSLQRRIKEPGVRKSYTLTLDNLKIGERAIIDSFAEPGRGYRLRLASMGLRVGSMIKVLYKEPFKGPVLIEVDGSRIAIGRNLAEKINVIVERDAKAQK
ncbi:MAG: ferrous iron transport protein A [Candidatus Omnitrophica bacterium]|nr:ferrous iron transport protein A [Candidatus Omnitrophota bacterium]